jgi:hypothetical protein
VTQLNRAAIESAAKGDTDRKEFYLSILENIQMLCAATGTNILAKTNSPQQPIQPPPPQAALKVTGANANFTYQITNPPLSVNATLYHELSYSPVSNFTSGTTVLPVSPATHGSVALPGTAVYWRLRSSYDQANWNSYTFAGLVSSGLQSSAATSNAVGLNQTNYAIVDSVDNGVGSANVRVYGTSGPQTMYPYVKGADETILPSATIVNVPHGTNKVVAYDGEQYMVKDTLPQVLADGLIPTGAVSVVGSGAFRLPMIVPIEVSGSILGYNITDGGNGLTGPVTITLVGSGSGATAGPQTIVGGELISVAPGNGGTGYGPGTTASVTGGTSSSGQGGGQAIGGNNGRFIYADSTTGGL